MDPVFFVESTSAYRLAAVTAEWTEDEHTALFGVSDIVKTDKGYLLSDSGNQRLVLFDRNLNLLAIVGRDGDGPGEYKFPEALAVQGDGVAVLDIGNSRVSHVTSAGAYVSSLVPRGNLNDLAVHPTLGLLVVGDAFPDHYLARVTSEGQSSFAEIPARLKDADVGFPQLRTELVAVTPDGSIHVLDGGQLAVATYREDGTSTQVAFLPQAFRTRKLERDARQNEALGGPSRVLASHLAKALLPLPDGRLFLGSTSGNTIGYFLDVEALEAVPIVIRDGDDWSWARGRTALVDGTRLVLTTGLHGGLAIVEMEFLEDAGARKPG